MFIVQELVAGKWFTVRSFDNEDAAQEFAAWASGRATRIIHNGKKIAKRVSIRNN